MFRKTLLAAVTILTIAAGTLVAPKEATAARPDAKAPAKLAAKGPGGYAVYYQKENGQWTYIGTFDTQKAQAVSGKLAERGFAVSLRSGASTHSPLNMRKAPAERQKVVASRAFPYLGENFEVMGPATPRYNCIAWSCGITGRWVWPGASVRDFDKLYAQHGYRRVKGLDYRRVPGMQKVVLYGHVQTVNGRRVVKCTHASRQLADGTWSSKLGKLPLIRHLTPDSIDGFGSTQYGRPVAVYVREERA